MFSIRQEYIENEQLKYFEAQGKSYEEFKENYCKLAAELLAQSPSYSEGREISARIYIDLYFSSAEDYQKKLKTARSLAPVMEIAMDRAISGIDGGYLINYRKNGFYLENNKKFFRISLGDSNDRDFSLGIVSLFYAILYDEYLLNEYYNKFDKINERIIDGGFNSASFNGLQGYYFSSYFIKWLLDMKEDASKSKVVNSHEFQPIYELFDQLDNPKDRILLARRCQ